MLFDLMREYRPSLGGCLILSFLFPLQASKFVYPLGLSCDTLMNKRKTF